MNDAIAEPERLTCFRCGHSSTLADVFVRGRDGTASRTWCPECAASGSRKIFYLTLGCLLVATASAALGLALGHERKLYWAVLAVSSFILSQYLMILPHELGHALAARMVGLRPLAMLVGQGTPWVDRDWWGTRLRIGTVLQSGATFLTLRPARGIDWRFIATTVAGPLVNLLFGVAAYLAARHWPEDSLSMGWRMVILGFALANLFMAAANLWPHTLKSPAGLVSSDGALILQRLKREPIDHPVNRAGLRLMRAGFAYQDRDFARAAKEARKALALSNSPTVVALGTALLAEALSESDRPREALDVLTPQLTREDLAPSMRLQLDQAFAWAALLVDEAEVRTEGLWRIAGCVRLMPWDGVLAIKRACLAAASATSPEGRADAARLVAELDKFRHHGESLAYLALARGLAAAINNDSRRAREEYEQARSLGATSAPLRVLERRIASG